MEKTEKRNRNRKRKIDPKADNKEGEHDDRL